MLHLMGTNSDSALFFVGPLVRPAVPVLLCMLNISAGFDTFLCVWTTSLGLTPC